MSFPLPFFGRASISALALSVITGFACLVAPTAAEADGRSRKSTHVGAERTGSPPVRPAEFEHGSVLRISEREGLPQTKAIRLARHKSLLVELPRELRDVVVSDPERVDAVVQTSNRVFLIAKSKTTGQANVFFFDTDGNQILTLEITIDRDSVPLESFLNRHIAGAAEPPRVLRRLFGLSQAAILSSSGAA
jgi:pilus assembly protein CpaC